MATILACGCSRAKPAPPRGPSGFPSFRLSGQGPHGEMLRQAHDAWTNGDRPEAIRTLRELIKADPQNHDGLFFLAHVLQDEGMSLAHGREAKTGYGYFQESAK